MTAALLRETNKKAYANDMHPQSLTLLEVHIFMGKQEEKT